MTAWRYEAWRESYVSGPTADSEHRSGGHIDDSALLSLWESLFCGLRMPSGHAIPSHFIHLLRGMLHPDPLQRLSLQEVSETEKTLSGAALFIVFRVKFDHNRTIITCVNLFAIIIA